MADLFKEVDEALKQEKAEKLWKVYGKYAIAAAVAIVIATAAYVWWQDYQLQNAQKRTGMLGEVLQLARDQKPVEALDLVDKIVADKDDGIRTVALFHGAAIAHNSQNNEKMEALLAQIIDDKNQYSELAEIILISLKGAQVKGTSVDVDNLIAKIRPYTDANNSMNNIAGYILASLYLRKGDREKATETLQILADDLSADGLLRSEANQAIKALKSQ